MIRTFGLNSPEFYEVMCRPEERPWIPNGSLRREPKWPKGDDRVWVRGADDESAEGAFREWVGHVDGRFTYARTIGDGKPHT